MFVDAFMLTKVNTGECSWYEQKFMNWQKSYVIHDTAFDPWIANESFMGNNAVNVPFMGHNINEISRSYTCSNSFE